MKPIKFNIIKRYFIFFTVFDVAQKPVHEPVHYTRTWTSRELLLRVFSMTNGVIPGILARNLACIIQEVTVKARISIELGLLET